MRPRVASARVWALSVAVASIATVLIWSQAGSSPRALSHIVPWWLFVGLFYVAEVTVLHFRFRRHIHSFSMSEVPLIIGIVLLSPVRLQAAHVLGSALALAIARRQSLMKLTFNVSQIALQVSVATLLFNAIVMSEDPLGPRGWLGAAAVALVTYAISTLLIGTAIRLSGGRVDERERAAMLSLSSLAGLMNVALGLAVTTILVSRPASAWLAVVPPMILYFAYRAYISQRQERERLQGLYTVSRELHRLPRMQDAFEAALEHALQTFNADRAEIYFYPDGPDAPGSVSVRCADGTTETLRPAAPVADGTVLGEVATTTPSIIIAGGRVKGSRGAQPSMFARIPCNDGAFSAFVVKEPLDDIGVFGPPDLRLLETLASQLGVSIENERLGASVAHLTEIRDRLRHQASHDPLTGLANRPRLVEAIQSAVDGGRSASSALLYVDLDGFKRVNDTHGHSIGDQLLIHVASVLLACCRGEDVVARLGGDEFVVLLEDLKVPSDAEIVADRIVSRLQQPFDAGGVELTAKASVGLAMLSEAESTEEIINAADRAMYEAKREGLGSYRVHARVSSRLPFHERGFRSEVARAIRASEFVVEYQPIVELETGDIVAVEALVRWNHPRRGRLEPSEFIPLAERVGVVGQIDRWVVDAAIAELTSELGERGVELPRLSVNASAVELNDIEFSGRLLAQLDRHRFPAPLLQLEVTESAIVDEGAAVLTRLRREGVRVALDDFGTGYSSLAYLDELPVDVIKIDRSFTGRLGRARIDSLVSMMLQIGETLSLDVIAEGIEVTEQRQILADLGCRYGQGFGISRPVPIGGLLALMGVPRAPARLQVIAAN